MLTSLWARVLLPQLQNLSTINLKKYKELSVVRFELHYNVTQIMSSNNAASLAAPFPTPSQRASLFIHIHLFQSRSGRNNGDHGTWWLLPNHRDINSSVRSWTLVLLPFGEGLTTLVLLPFGEGLTRGKARPGLEEEGS
jgi:hypothetical protein